MSIKVMTAKEAVDIIKSGKTISTEGFVGNAFPEELMVELEKKYLETGCPRDLTLLYSAGQGDTRDRGLNHLGHEGLLTCTIGGHWNLAHKVQKLALENKMKAYNFPQGVIAQMFRDIAAKRPGTLTHVGLKTFVDPRLGGGKLNSITTEDLVEVVQVDGKDYLLYKGCPIDYAFLRGTYADEKGNVTMDHEVCTLGALCIAQACRNSGGTVIVQVEKVVKSGSLDPRMVKIPGIYVDIVVPVTDKQHHMQTFGTDYNPSLCGDVVVPVDKPAIMPLDERKVICRRAAMELTVDSVVNLGIGMPEGVAGVAYEEGVSDTMTLTIESGPIGGIPLAGLDFGAAINPEAIIDQANIFDFYDGGGLDQAFLGLAECDRKGNINVSKFGPKIAGAGGFIDITQNSKKVIFCGTFTAKGLKLKIGDGELKILEEGKVKKFVKDVEQITFSGDYARENAQVVKYITERAVFELHQEGLILVEIAPGIDLEKDVLGQMEFEVKVSPHLKLMDKRIFTNQKMGLVIKS